jgi:DNA-binding NarL/FixJ family response regulator
VIRVLVVDDDALVRTGIAQLLREAPDVEVTGEAPDGEAALAAVEASRPDVVLLDLSMRGLDAVATLRDLRQRHPELRVIMLSAYSDRNEVLGAFDAGAAGYLLKDSSPESLLGGIRAVMAGETPMSPAAATVILSSWRTGHAAPQLTQRERQVLSLLAEGTSNKAIGHRLGISEKTVKAHVTAILQALDVTDRTQAAVWVRQHGFPDGEVA